MKGSSSRKEMHFQVGKRRDGLKRGGGVPGLPVCFLALPQKRISLGRTQLGGRPARRLLRGVKTALENLEMARQLLKVIASNQRSV